MGPFLVHLLGWAHRSFEPAGSTGRAGPYAPSLARSKLSRQLHAAIFLRTSYA